MKVKALEPCKWVRLARDRHIRDLEHGAERGLWFDVEAAQRVVDFFRLFLRHYKGEWQGKPFELAEWEKADILGPLFGWMRLPKDIAPKEAKSIPLDLRIEAGIVRRYRTAYLEVARKNGKSTLLAGIGDYMTIGDREHGAEVYTAATKREQAKILHDIAKRMLARVPELMRNVTIMENSITVPALHAKFVPLPADPDKLDGLDPHCNIVDEFHAHKSTDLWDVLTTGEGSRRQSLTVAITTAGFDRTGPCYAERLYAQKVLERIIEDDAYFAIIYSLDEGDDWRDDRMWHKANPGLGVSPKKDYLVRQVKKAQESPSYMNTVLTKHFNIWTQRERKFFDMDAWDKCGEGADPVEWRRDLLEEYGGRTCYAGLDLGSVSDFTALALMWPEEDGRFTVVPWFWIPSDAHQHKERKFRKLYRDWETAGFLNTTDGNVTDYKAIRIVIRELAEQYIIKDVAVDRLFQGAQLCSELMEDGHNIIAFGQGFYSMAAPTKAIEELVLSGKLQHGNNPILRDQAGNTEVKTDPAGNMKPCKPERGSAFKIDGIVATIMALGRATAPENVVNAANWYEANDLVTAGN